MEDENPARVAYLAAMRLGPVPEDSEEARQGEGVLGRPRERSRWEKALERAYNNRALEIDLYWKRSAYYWAFQAAAFAAVGLLFKDGWTQESVQQLLALAFCGLGLLTALAGVLAAKGSKFWQENWELHVDMLESENEGNLHKTVFLKEGKPAFSVSRTNLTLHQIFFCFWLLLGSSVVLRIGNFVGDFNPTEAAFLLVSLCFIGTIFLLWNRTDFDGRKITPWQPGGWRNLPSRSRRRLAIVRRIGPDEQIDSLPR